jgi:hypothetical protein
MIAGLAITGTSSYNSDLNIFNSNLEVSGDKKGTLVYNYNYQTQTATLTGEYGGETINLSR